MNDRDAILETAERDRKSLQHLRAESVEIQQMAAALERKTVEIIASIDRRINDNFHADRSSGEHRKPDSHD